MEIAISPNPANETLEIKTMKGILNDPYEVFDAIGNIIVSKSNIENNSIDISKLKMGVYFIKINGMSYKFIKQ